MGDGSALRQVDGHLLLLLGALLDEALELLDELQDRLAVGCLGTLAKVEPEGKDGLVEVAQVAVALADVEQEPRERCDPVGSLVLFVEVPELEGCLALLKVHPGTALRLGGDLDLGGGGGPTAHREGQRHGQRDAEQTGTQPLARSRAPARVQHAYDTTWNVSAVKLRLGGGPLTSRPLRALAASGGHSLKGSS